MNVIFLYFSSFFHLLVQVLHSRISLYAVYLNSRNLKRLWVWKLFAYYQTRYPELLIVERHRSWLFELGCGLWLSRGSLMCGLMPVSEIFIDRLSGAPWRGTQSRPARPSTFIRSFFFVPNLQLCFSFSLHSFYLSRFFLW